MPDGETPETNPEREGAPASGAEAPVSGSPQHTSPSAAPPSPEPLGADVAPGATAVPDTPLPSAARGRKGAWAALAVLCAIAGTVGSVLGARAVVHTDNVKARQAFPRTSAEIDSTLKLDLQHEEDLVISASTFFAGNPKATARQFDAWVHWSRALRRYPELQRLGLVALVRSPELAAFEAQVSGHPLKPGSHSTQPAGKALRLVPAGTRSFYCLTAVELARGSARPTAAGLDHCALTPALLASRDSANSVYASASAAHGPGLEVLAPVYQNNLPPAGFDARRAAFVGWLRGVLAPEVVLRETLAGHPGYAIHLRQSSGGSDVVFVGATPQPGSQSSTANLHGGWTVRTFGPTAATVSVFTDAAALALLITGTLLSILLGLLIFLLGTAGSPLLGTAGSRTPAPDAPEVPHEELYDALTGLPNRALLLDRADRMLARAGRLSDSLVGALFIDIDWFKDINDKLGVAAGDELLRIVAERLEDVVRTHDTVGRLEGDKFVVLVESAARGMRLDSLARRVMEVLHKPVELEGFGPSFSLTVSIGVAFGRYATPDDLLHDAEHAMHTAEAAGRDRFTVFNANMRSVIEGRGELEVELNTALQEKQLFLLYQPIFDLIEPKRWPLSRRSIRWQHPPSAVCCPPTTSFRWRRKPG